MIFTDQITHTIRLDLPVERIVSLVPSQTELLFDLGLDKEVVGITKFCIHPQVWFKSKNRVGGTKNVDFEKLRALKPDLVIANKEENSKEDIEQLQKEFNVWTSDIFSLAEAYEMIAAIGALVSRKKNATELIKKIKRKQANFSLFNSVNVLYFIWANPYMIAGENTFISSFMTELGLNNFASKLDDKRYPMLSPQEIKNLNPALLLCSSEPFPFKDEHMSQLTTETGIPCVFVDGEYFSWYGSRLEKAFDYFEELKKDLN